MITLNLQSRLLPYMNDVPEIVRAFFPYVAIETDGAPFILESVENEDSFVFIVTDGDNKSVFELPIIRSAETYLNYKKLTKRYAKNCLYTLLSEKTGVKLPYGSLTGVRPTRLLYEPEFLGKDKTALIDNFFVSPERAALIADVIENQAGIYTTDPCAASIYINVPFCPTRCSYCSFISTEIGRIRNKIPLYIDSVKREIDAIKNTIAVCGYNLRSIYVGGGTPTSLDAETLCDMLSGLRNPGVEFTVESGRPDSISVEKLDALKFLGVTRISVNPQTLKDETLKLIGRAHTAEDFYNAYSAARKYDFDINVDLIAGLPSESPEDFASSLDGIIKLKPENITVHTLSLKRGSELLTSGAVKCADGAAKTAADYARTELKKNGYLPYYMYRQKNTADNLENVGYTVNGKACVYNVAYMEETDNVFSAGAGGVSKTVNRNTGEVVRRANPKGLNEYLERTGGFSI